MKDLSEYMTECCVHFSELVIGTVENAIAEAQRVDGIDISARYVRSSRDGCQPNQIAHIYHCNLCGEEERHVVAVYTDSVYIGECPSEEEPFKKYAGNKVAQAFALQLNNTFVVPLGAQIVARRQSTGGGYTTVLVEYSTEYPYAVAFALMVESETPERWSPAAKRYLEGNVDTTSWAMDEE
jgi:hypothetical protein